MQDAQNKELALYLMGMLHNSLFLSYDTVTQILNSHLKQDSPLIIRLRTLWFLEKVARDAVLFREGKLEKVKGLFEPLCEFFVKQDEFVFQYQGLLTMMAYLKQVKLVETYPERYPELIADLSSKVTALLEQCNEETVDAPLAALKYLAKLDTACTQEMLRVVIKPVLSLFDKYFQDAMLSDDILQLLQTLGNVPDNTVFKQAVLPEVQAVVQRLHSFACEQQNSQEVQ